MHTAPTDALGAVAAPTTPDDYEIDAGANVFTLRPAARDRLALEGMPVIDRDGPRRPGDVDASAMWRPRPLGVGGAVAAPNGLVHLDAWVNGADTPNTDGATTVHQLPPPRAYRVGDAADGADLVFFGWCLGKAAHEPAWGERAAARVRGQGVATQVAVFLTVRAALAQAADAGPAPPSNGWAFCYRGSQRLAPGPYVVHTVTERRWPRVGWHAHWYPAGRATEARTPAEVRAALTAADDLPNGITDWAWQRAQRAWAPLAVPRVRRVDHV